MDSPVFVVGTSDRSKKRKAGDQLAVSSDDDSDTSNFSRFLVVEAAQADKPIKFSIFAIQKLLQCAVGTVKSAKKLISGAVLVEVCTHAQYCNAMKMNTWVDVPVKVSAHRSLNSSRGVVRCRDFRDCDDEEILDALRPEGVTSLKHIHTKKNNTTTPTNTYILTFNRPTPPKSIRAAYLSIPVEPYVPNPLRCYNCQKFGHGKNACKRTAVCARCNKEGHTDTDCHDTPHCANCSGNHPAFSKDCPEWAKQKQITQVKFERNISFAEAKQVVLQLAPRMGTGDGAGKRSFATVTRSVRSAATQTNLTWPLDSKIPVATENITAVKTASSSQSQTEPVDGPLQGATGGQSTPNHLRSATVTNIPHYKPNVNHQRGQAANKPGPGSSKKQTDRQSKGSFGPLGAFNKYGALDDDDPGAMDDMETLRPSGRGSPKNNKK